MMLDFIGDVKMTAAMKRLNIAERDLEETFIRASGPGGQNVNKVATCVFLRHGPTGVTVKARKYRTQMENRVYARELLVEEIERRQQEMRLHRIQVKEKARRQNRRRPQSLKERILVSKKKLSEKKKLRRSVGDHDW